MIYVFDSGLGGLTALASLRKLAPDADIVYFGDTSRVPYGTRSREVLLKYARQDMRFLLSSDASDVSNASDAANLSETSDVTGISNTTGISNFTDASPESRAVLVACGTVSSVALEELRAEFEVQITGVVDGAAKKAAALTKNGVVGVIATSATIRTDAFGKTLRGINPDISVVSAACPLLVSLVEYGFVEPDDPVTVGAAERYLRPLRDAGVDTLILGCTHFPIIADAISRALPGVALVNSGAEAAAAVVENKAAAAGHGRVRYYVSDKPETFISTAKIFLGHELESEVGVIDIDRY